MKPTLATLKAFPAGFVRRGIFQGEKAVRKLEIK
jgi:hypothetical protein